MKIKHITFTGVDERTDIEELVKIQKEFPIAEFGVLLSTNWRKNGNRYMNPKLFERFHGKGLNLSCHACGRIAREAINNDWSGIASVLGPHRDLFKRCQLNISSSLPNEKTGYFWVPSWLEEVIIQQKDPEQLDLFKAIGDKNKITVLLDASGGNGIDTGVYPFCFNETKIGYAGGINIDNVGIKFKTLLESNISYKFWIDMESGVRTDDWFDTDKVWQVLEECDKVLRDVEGFSMKTTEPPKHEHTFKMEGYLKTLCYDDQIGERRYAIKEAIASQLRFLQNKAILDAKPELGGKEIWYFEINEIK